MEPNRLEKIDNFTKRHLLLSSLLCLFILSLILEFYRFYMAYDISTPLEFKGIAKVIFLAKNTVFNTGFCLIPIFIISLLLWSFLKKQSSPDATLSFSRKFIFSFIPALAIILLFSIWIVQDIPKPYAGNPMFLYPLAILTSCFYSAVFGAFFGWQSKVSRVEIIVQSVIVSFLMVIISLFLYGLSQISL